MGDDSGNLVPGEGRSTRTLGILMAVALGVLIISIVRVIPGVQGFFQSNHHAEYRYVEESHKIVPNIEQEKATAKEVFMLVEEMPELVGGMRALAAKVHYPEIAKEAGIQGKVFIQFVVDTDGSVIDPVVVRGIGGGCDEAALSALLESTFKPGKQRGKNVAVKMSLPVVFKMQ